MCPGTALCVYAAVTTSVKATWRGQAQTATHMVISGEEMGAESDPWSIEAEQRA